MNKRRGKRDESEGECKRKEGRGRGAGRWAWHWPPNSAPDPQLSTTSTMILTLLKIPKPRSALQRRIETFKRSFELSTAGLPHGELATAKRVW